jgi:murein DD-endopeptidase MepM/ murein hydrolase activator NlpD
MIKKSYFSIIITSQDAKTFHKFNLSNIVVGLISLSILGAVVASVIMVYTYMNFHVMARELSTLKKENSFLSEELTGFKKSYKRIAARVETIKQIDQQLRTLTAVDSDSNEIFGIGGPSPEDASLKDLAERHDDLAAAVGTDLDRLLAESRQQEESFNELMSFMEEQKDFMDSTPAVWPIKGFLSSKFGMRWGRLHAGIDIANKVGTVILAPADGIVIFAGVKQGYGNFMTLSHGYGITTNYGHLYSVLVKVGDKVKRGDRIALSGNSGNTTGPHLHYEVELNGIHVDPLYYIMN